MINKIERIKEHIKENKKYYIVGITSGLIVSVTSIVAGIIINQHIKGEINIDTDHGIGILGNRNVLHNVSYIDAHRQGPPSWVIRCLETGAVFVSQRAAAFEMGISEVNISKQLNGLQENAEGFHFERICMAA